MRHRLAPARSHSSSAGSHRTPGGHNSACGIDVPIQDQAAPVTVKDTLTQRHRRLHPPTTRACFAAETRTRVLSRAPRPLPRSESGILRPLVEAVRERRLPVPQTLLQRHAGHVVEKRQIRGPFPSGQQCGGLRIADAALLLAPCGGPGCQRPVIDQTHTTEGPRQLDSLALGGIEAVSESPLHQRLRHTSHSSAITEKDRTHVRVTFPAVTSCRCGSTSPCPEDWGTGRLDSQ